MLKGAEQKLRNIPSTSTEDGTGIFAEYFERYVDIIINT